MTDAPKEPKDVLEASTTLTISMPLWMAIKLKFEAESRGLSRSALIFQMLSTFLGKNRPLCFPGKPKNVSEAEAAALEEAHEETMRELLPPPEKDPDLR